MPSDKTRILLVDDHELIRRLLSERLRLEEKLEVVATARSADDAIFRASEHRPDVILMDIELPGLNCFDAARRIRSALPDVRFIFLSAYSSDHYIEEALRVGASAYLTKDESAEKIIAAIHEVVESRSVFSDEIAERLVYDRNQPSIRPSMSKASSLTVREKEVLGYIATGMAKKRIATVMNVGVKTVEKHTENLMSKLDIHDRVDLARYAIREGITRP